MSNLLSHPFRVAPTGNIATTEESTESYMAERLALLMTTRHGERPLVPDFGLGDLEYEGVVESAVATQVKLWEIPISIQSVSEEHIDDEKSSYTIEFELDTEAEDV